MALAGWEVTVLATVMQSPFAATPPQSSGVLETRFRYPLQRIDALAAERDAYASVLFDGRGSQFRDLSRRFSGYLFHSNEGKAGAHIADTPAFVDSATSAGIQIADMCAYVVRVDHEKQLSRGPLPSGDEYLRAIRRWYRLIGQLTVNFTISNGQPLRGIYRLPPGVR